MYISQLCVSDMHGVMEALELGSSSLDIEGWEIEVAPYERMDLNSPIWGYKARKGPFCIIGTVQTYIDDMCEEEALEIIFREHINFALSSLEARTPEKIKI